MTTELLKFAGTFAKDQYLKDFQCPQCRQYISEQDIEKKNYMLRVSDYANEVSKDQHFDIIQYNLTFWLKSVEHQDCPDTKICQNCCMELLTSTMKKIDGEYYYCFACFMEVNHE